MDLKPHKIVYAENFTEVLNEEGELEVETYNCERKEYEYFTVVDVGEYDQSCGGFDIIYFDLGKDARIKIRSDKKGICKNIKTGRSVGILVYVIGKNWEQLVHGKNN